ncbi:hypothetical protein [Profundibacter sp.]
MAFRLDLKRWVKTLAGSRWVSFYDFEMFAPYSRGPNRQKTDQTFQAIHQLVPLLMDLSKLATGQEKTITPIEDFAEIGKESSEQLKPLLDSYGSDKANRHNYHILLGAILKDPEKVTAVLEVGLGTNNKDVVSNMGRKGHPGASVRAFRDFLPNATIYGADFDKRILFTEDRIKTYFVDQTSQETFVELAAHIPEECDLIIDDGLHSPHANIATLIFGLQKVKVGGWIVIEDVNPDTLQIWQLVSNLLPENFESSIVQSRVNLLFAVKRLS